MFLILVIIEEIENGARRRAVIENDPWRSRKVMKIFREKVCEACMKQV